MAGQQLYIRTAGGCQEGEFQLYHIDKGGAEGCEWGREVTGRKRMCVWNEMVFEKLLPGMVPERVVAFPP